MKELLCLLAGAAIWEIIHRTFFDNKDDQKINLIIQKLNSMAERTEQALADLQAIQGTLNKISAESSATLQKLRELEEAAANDDTPQSVLDKIAEVKAQVQVVDDLVPDAQPEEPETPEEPEIPEEEEPNP